MWRVFKDHQMKDIIEMAREAGFNKNELAYLIDNFIRFAELVRADEREACAKVASGFYASDASNYPSHIAAAIRARGQA
jgi:hypothetical protein